MIAVGECHHAAGSTGSCLRVSCALADLEAKESIEAGHVNEVFSTGCWTLLGVTSVRRIMTELTSNKSGTGRIDVLFALTFREVHSISKLIVRNAFGKMDKDAGRLIDLALYEQIPSEYPFLFKYAYCNTEQDWEEIKILAAAVHLIQTSTFVIDDIFDSSSERNHNKTICGKYGTDYAIVAGELLQSFALETISSELEHRQFANACAVFRIVNQILREVYLGQYLDMYNSSAKRTTTKEYYKMISLTTGNFLANIARCGAMLSNKRESDIRFLAAFGYQYGMGMQIADDIVDITETPRTTGKSFANDLKCRRMRLPYILALRLTHDKKDRAYLEEFLRRRETSTKDVNDVAKLIEKCGAIAACKLIARRFALTSLQSLSCLKNTLTKESLGWLSESLLGNPELLD